MALDVVEIVLGFLSSGGGKAEKLLGEYIDKTLKMKKRRFSQKVKANSNIHPPESLSGCLVIVGKSVLSTETCFVPLGDHCGGASQTAVPQGTGAV